MEPTNANTPAATQPPAGTSQFEGLIVDLRNELKRANERLDSEKRSRITAEVKRRGENRIPNDKIDKWVSLAMNDEAGTFELIDSMPTAQPGGEPIGHSVELVNEGEFDRIAKLPTSKERYAAFAKDWDNLFEEACRRDERGNKPRILNRYPARTTGGRPLPENANTLSATITTSFLLDGAVTILQNRWSPLMAFTRDFSTDAYKPLATAVGKYVSATTAATTTTTDFEVGGDTIDPISVTMAHYFKSFSVTQPQLNSGLRMQNLIEINSAGLADAIIKAATDQLTTANFDTTPGTTGAAASLVCTGASFGFSELQTLWGNLKKSPIKNILLDGSHLARIINNPTWYQTAGVQPGGGWKAFGWDYIALNTVWGDSSVTNLCGFACNPQAILAVAGLPLNPPEGIPGNTLQMSTAVVPDVGVTVATYSWFALKSRTAFSSFDLMFGASAMDKTAGVLIKSA